MRRVGLLPTDAHSTGRKVPARKKSVMANTASGGLSSPREGGPPSLGPLNSPPGAGYRQSPGGVFSEEANHNKRETP